MGVIDQSTCMIYSLSSPRMEKIYKSMTGVYFTMKDQRRKVDKSCIGVIREKKIAGIYGYITRQIIQIQQSQRHSPTSSVILQCHSPLIKNKDRGIQHMTFVCERSLHRDNPVGPSIAFRCLPSQLLGASARRCNTMLFICKRPAKS